MSANPAAEPIPARASDVAKLLVPVAIGAGVAVSLGGYGALHQPTGIAVSIAGFSGPQTVKVWLTTGVIVLATVQALSALVMYGQMPAVRGRTPGWVGTVHRWSGRTAFLLSIPVAVHCLYAMGFQATDTRVLVHSLLGCVFFGAFTVKMLLLTRTGLPGLALPLAGGVVLATIVGLWLSSALWFFATIGFEL